MHGDRLQDDVISGVNILHVNSVNSKQSADGEVQHENFLPFSGVHKLNRVDGLHNPIYDLSAPASLYAIKVRIVSAGLQQCVSFAKKSLGPVSAITGRNITQYIHCNQWASESCDTSHGRPVLRLHCYNCFIFCCWAENLGNVLKNHCHGWLSTGHQLGGRARSDSDCAMLWTRTVTPWLLRKGYSAETWWDTASEAGIKLAAESILPP